MTYSSFIRSIAAATFFVSAACSGADVWPAGKPGLWETSMSMMGMPAHAAGKHCRGDQPEAPNMGPDTPGKTCQRPVLKTHGNTVIADAVCVVETSHSGKSTMHVHSVTTFNGNESAHSDVVSRADPPIPNMPPEMKMTLDSRWVGSCPANMQPGDLMMMDGTIHRPTKPNP